MLLKSVLIFVVLFLAYLSIGYIIFKIRLKSNLRKDETIKKENAQSQVNSTIYDSDYYLHAYSEDPKKYLSDLQNLPVALHRCFDYADPKPDEKVLDLGCGRGHLSYFCVLKGCVVTAVDYSKDAIDLALKTKEALPDNLRDKMTVKQMDFKNLDTNEKFDIIFMADLIEHLYDWELKILFEKARQVLKPRTGRLIIHTAPNKTWINVIFPLKRILDWPSTLKKNNDFYYTRDKYSYDPEMHVNEQTLSEVRKLLKGFKAKVWCDDGSSNVVSILTKKFAGADIWAIARIDE